jgi:rhodanese-related sulfurtransferase
VTGAELIHLIDAGRAPAILDVRTPEEFAAGHVPGAINVPFQDVGRRFVERGLPLAGRFHLRQGYGGQVASRPTSDTSRPPMEPIVIYCGHGPRAWLAGAALRRRGFRAFEYLKGHMAAWRRAGMLEER